LHNAHLHKDKELFRRISAGDKDAFSIIFHAYFDPLYSNAFRLLKSEFWAEDVVQLVFTQLWMNRSSLERVDNPSAWLYRMVTNKVRDRMRKQELEIKMQYWLSTNAETFSNEKPSSGNREELHLLLENAVNALPPQRQEVYRLRYQQDLSYEEIAERLSLSKNTVRNHLAKALEDIRGLLLKQAGITGLLFFYCLF
jgi:RNA polymerase sigma-70 factor (ECF subfamily)